MTQSPHSQSYCPDFAPLSLQVGDRAHILHSYTGDNYYDLGCGDTTVVRIKSNGTVVLANSMEFRRDGTGLAKNSACRIGPARFPHNDRSLPMDVREEAYVQYRAALGSQSPDQDRAEWRGWFHR